MEENRKMMEKKEQERRQTFMKKWKENESRRKRAEYLH
jgi:hypothetical protein